MSKGLYRYFLGTSLFFIVMALSFVRIWENNNQQFWLSIWYSDRFFVFGILIILSVGFAIIDKETGSTTPIRFFTRKRYAFTQLGHYLLLSWLVISSYELFFLIASQLNKRALESINKWMIVNHFLHFLCGAFLVASMILVLQRVNISIIAKHASIIIFILFIIEIFFWASFAKNSGFPINKIIFGWIFDDSWWSLLGLFIGSMIFGLLSAVLIKRKDFL